MSALGLGVSIFGFRVSGFGFRFSIFGSRFRVFGFRFSVVGLWYSVFGSEIPGFERGGWGSGCWGFGFRVSANNERGRCAARAEDAEGTPTQSHISPSIPVYEDYLIMAGTAREPCLGLAPPDNVRARRPEPASGLRVSAKLEQGQIVVQDFRQSPENM